jgi:hypothetical protein
VIIRFEGQFKDDMRHGFGRLEYANGDIYEGEFSFNSRNGKGEFTYSSGEKYIGDYYKASNNIDGYYLLNYLQLTSLLFVLCLLL